MKMLLTFIDTMSLDDTLYWRVPVGNSFAEVTWRRKDLPGAWQVKFAGDEQGNAGTSEELLALLTRRDADIAAFERQVGVSVLTQAVFADMVVAHAKELFGDDAVQRSIDDTKSFLGAITDTAKRLSRDPAPVTINASLKLRLV